MLYCIYNKIYKKCKHISFKKHFNVISQVNGKLKFYIFIIYIKYFVNCGFVVFSLQISYLLYIDM